MQISDKIVAIKFTPCHCGCNKPFPFLPNVVYVVSEFRMSKSKPGKYALNAIGVSAYPHQAFPAARFRKLDELKQLAKEKQTKQVKTT